MRSFGKMVGVSFACWLPSSHHHGSSISTEEIVTQEMSEALLVIVLIKWLKLLCPKENDEGLLQFYDHPK